MAELAKYKGQEEEYIREREPWRKPSKKRKPAALKQFKAQSGFDLVRVVIDEAREVSQAMQPSRLKGLKFTTMWAVAVL